MARLQDQTIIGTRGNCLSACVAAILDLPIADVPLFFDDTGRVSQHDLLNRWLRPRGFYAVVCDPPADPAKYPRGLYVLCGGSPRFENVLHATVGMGPRVIFDPHPDKTDITGVTHLIIIVPFDPSDAVWSAP